MLTFMPLIQSTIQIKQIILIILKPGPIVQSVMYAQNDKLLTLIRLKEELPWIESDLGSVQQ